MPYSQGDIVIVPFPFSDQTGNKVRPAIIVSNDMVNDGPDSIILQLSTTAERVPDELKFIINNGDVTTPFSPPHDQQQIILKNISTIKKTLIRGSVTTLQGDRLTDLLERLRELLS